MNRLIEEKGWPTVWLPRLKHLAVFFNVPAQAPTLSTPLTVISEQIQINNLRIQMALGIHN